MHCPPAQRLFRSLATLMLVVALTIQPVMAGLPGCGNGACDELRDRAACCLTTAQQRAEDSDRSSCCNIAAGSERGPTVET
ncbi:MAG: hypothetical protein ACF8TS_09865, partial [Maioricimonas sp. JB049]